MVNVQICIPSQNDLLGYACECFSYLGGHNPVITELGWYESLSGGTRTMTNIDSSTVYSSLITTKLEEDTAGEVEMDRD